MGFSQGDAGISNATDVALNNPATGQGLVFNTTSSKWQNQPVYAKPIGGIPAADLNANVQAALSSSVKRIFYNSSTSSWPARPSVSLVPAGLVEYLSSVAGVSNPTDMQVGDTLDIALAVSSISFDNNASNWTGTYSNSTTASSTAQLHGAAPNSISITSTSATTSYGMDSTGSGRQSVIAGGSYQSTVYMYTANANRQALMNVSFYQSDGTPVSGGTSSSPSAALTQNAWNAIVTTFTAPAGAVFVAAAPVIQYLYAAQSVPSGDVSYFSAL